MNLFITSSPFLWGTGSAFLNPENHFVENLQEVLPPFPRMLFVASDPERHDLTCTFGMDIPIAFCQAGMPFSAFQVLDGTNAGQAAQWCIPAIFWCWQAATSLLRTPFSVKSVCGKSSRISKEPLWASAPVP